VAKYTDQADFQVGAAGYRGFTEHCAERWVLIIRAGSADLSPRSCRRINLANDRPRPYRTMIAYVAAIVVVAFALAGWYSYKVHPGDPQRPASATTTVN